jgi:isoleucyl-tRNA synthetase
MLPDSIEWENKEVQDLNKYFLAWTTTPWTLMSNL